MISNEKTQDVTASDLNAIVSCVRATNIVSGCVVKMKASSKLPGYGNAQCVKDVNKMLDTISLYGHNQHYKVDDVEMVLEYPLIEANAANTR